MPLSRAFAVLLFFVLVCCSWVNASESGEVATMTVDALFDRMEKKTENINSIGVEVELNDGIGIKKAKLMIKNPDRFAIEFQDDSFKVYFNGTKLWIYIKDLNEAFYHEVSKNNLLSKLSFINPRKIFTRLTRTTLFTLFNIKLQSQNKTEHDVEYVLDFVPKLEGIFKKIFDAGNYFIVFSEKNYLPVRVIEFDIDKKQKGVLNVIEYKINEETPDSAFSYIPGAETAVVPLTAVIAQKIEQYFEDLKERASKSLEDFKNFLIPW